MIERDQRRRHHRQSSFCQWCRDLEIQKLRLAIARIFIYLSQAFSLSFCVYVGAGSENICLWLNLTTSLLGVIIGHEMTRILALHKFYSANISPEDINFVDLRSSQALLGSLRRWILMIGNLNIIQSLLRVVVLGSWGLRDTSVAILNVTKAINAEFPTLGSDLGLIQCENDCAGVMGITLTNRTTLDVERSIALTTCVEKCRASQDMFVAVLAITGALQISAFFLARLIRYGRID
jgi:hypothetical protein